MRGKVVCYLTRFGSIRHPFVLAQSHTKVTSTRFVVDGKENMLCISLSKFSTSFFIYEGNVSGRHTVS